MIWGIRIILLVLIIFSIYRILMFLFHPRRKLELAREKHKFYIYDEEDNVRKNFLLTYKGVTFEGEKYLGATKDSFDVVSISIGPQLVMSLKGFVQEDFREIEQKIHEHYPKAKVDWKSPVKEFLHPAK